MNNYEVTTITEDGTEMQFEMKAESLADLFQNLTKDIDLENIKEKTVVDLRAKITSNN
ncbi:hypothetical protein [Salinicoccus albus]|uniref:hypothetical protein n=1 Tax=Salinicoccus albus TaxID=418756 RepID=UPI000378089F|nr:hypothetical protein [Salinicoccus albus]